LELEELTPVIKLLMMEYLPIFRDIHNKLKDRVCEEFFDWMDVSKAGQLSLRQFKSGMLAAWFDKIP
jgi:hypothetical protein